MPSIAELQSRQLMSASKQSAAMSKGQESFKAVAQETWVTATDTDDGRTLADWMAAVANAEGAAYNVKDYRATGGGVVDDAPYIQAAIDACLAGGGGIVYFPPGTYKIGATLEIDTSAVTGNHAQRVHLVGAGVASVIDATGLGDAAVEFTHGSSYPQSHDVVSDLRFLSNRASGSVAVSVSIGAWFTMRNVVIEGFDYGFDGTDCEQSYFESCTIRFNNNGMRLNAAAATSDPNSITFVNVCVSNNDKTGLFVDHANSFQMLGGSIQYNGTIGGGSTEWGARFDDAASTVGYGTILLAGVAFEGNGGDGDLIWNQASALATLTLSACSFMRTNQTTVGYGTNCIKVAGSSTNQVLVLIGTHFRHTAGYTPDGGRPVINRSNTSARIHDDGAGYYQSSTEAPTWAAKTIVPRPLGVGVGPTNVLGAFTARAAADKNVYLSTNFNLSAGTVIGSINDAYSSLQPLELRATVLALTATAGDVHFPTLDTTASAANAFLDSGSTPANQLMRSTSSLAYKRDVETIEDKYADAILSFTPIWYRSKCKADNPEWSWYGLAAEEVAGIDPRLVHWGYGADDYDTVSIMTDDGPQETRVLKDGAEKSPQGVAYERLTVLLLNIVKRQGDRLAALEAR